MSDLGGRAQAPRASRARPVAADGNGGEPHARIVGDRGRNAAQAAAIEPAQPQDRAGAPGGGVFFGQAFAVVDTVEVCFRKEDDAANLRAAAQWLSSRPGWFLRALWYEHQGAYEISQYDNGPHGALWMIAERGSDRDGDAGAAAGSDGS